MALPWRLNLLLTVAVLLSYLAFYVCGAAVLGAGRSAEFALICLVFICLTPTLWGLVHEGIHGRLTHNPRANRAASRALCVLLGFSFETVQFGHLMHHRYNGHEYDRPERMKAFEPAWRGWLRHWGHLLGGHYLFTAMVGVVAFAPAGWRERALQRAFPGQQPDMAAMRLAALKWSSDPRRIRRIQMDCAAGALLLVAAIEHYATFWPLLLTGLYGRALLYSVLDNLPHYGLHGRGNTAARNMTLPPWASVLVLNHHLHRAHHESPNLPWRDLSRRVSESSTDGSYLLAAIRQLSGPIRARS